MQTPGEVLADVRAFLARRRAWPSIALLVVADLIVFAVVTQLHAALVRSVGTQAYNTILAPAYFFDVALDVAVSVIAVMALGNYFASGVGMSRYLAKGFSREMEAVDPGLPWVSYARALVMGYAAAACIAAMFWLTGLESTPGRTLALLFAATLSKGFFTLYALGEPFLEPAARPAPATPETSPPQ